MKAKLVLCSCLLSVVAAAVCVVPCQAAEYYVDARHAQAADENSGRETSPWKTISRAVQVARAGDTVWIKAGKYREGVRYFAHSGEYYASELRFITLAAYRNDVVIIDGTRKVDPGEWKLKEGAKNVFWIALPEDPNQVFVDGERLAEAIEVKVEDKPDAELGTQRTTTRREIAVTDATPDKWLYDEKTRRLHVNTGEGNPSQKHLLEVSVNSFALNLQPRPGTRYGGRGVYNVAIRLRGLTFDRLRTGLDAPVNFSVIEDCVVRQAGAGDGSAMTIRGMHNIIRRNTVLDSLHQAIYWVGKDFVLEDNLVVGALQDPHIVDGAFEGVFKANNGSYSTIRNNVVAEVPPGKHHGGGLGIWCDINSEHNAIYGNACYRQGASGIYVEQSQNANVIAYNTCFENRAGLGVRNNSFNLILGNYLFNNRSSGIWFGSENRYPPMTGQRVEGNWLVNNSVGVSLGLPSPLGWNVASLDRNFYETSRGGKLVEWGEKVYTDLDTLRRKAGQEFNGKTGKSDEKDIQVVRFRVPHSRTPGAMVPMVANPTLLRAAPSGVGGYANRPYFWRQGDGSGLSFGVGAAGPWSITSGIIETSYPNLPRLWADGGAYAAGIIAVVFGPDGRLLEKHEGPGEKRWGIYVHGTQPEDMHPLGEGWWSPSLPTVAGTKYKVSWRSLAEKLEPLRDNSRSGPVVFVQWTNDTGQDVVRHYLWGKDDKGRPHGKLSREGSYPWMGDSGKAIAPAGARRVRFFFGLRQCQGIVKYRDLFIEGS